LAGKYSPSEKE